MANFLSNVFGGANNSGTDDKTNQNQQQQQNNNNNNNDNNNNNNNNNNIDSQDNIWDNNSTTEDDNNNNNNNQNQNQNQNQQTKDADTLFKEHIESLQLTNGLDLAKIQEDLREGKVDSLNEAFSNVAANTYKAAMTQMNSLVDSKIEAATEKAVSDANSTVKADLEIQEMQSSLPFTKDPNIEPVAKAVLAQFRSKGESVENAIAKTKEFFQNTAEKVGNVSIPPNDKPGTRNFSRNNQQQNNDQNIHDEWLDVLSQ